MTSIDKSALRTAILIHERLAQRNLPSVPLQHIQYAGESIQRLERQINIAKQRGWLRAAAALTAELSSTLEDCRRQIDYAAQRMAAESRSDRICTAAEIYADILALHDEFQGVRIELEEHTLAVTTDTIILENIRLGRFEIRLNWQTLSDYQPYRVVAREPNPAAKGDDYTHPHVQSERLSEGEGQAAIQAALRQGRLYDFFGMVSRVLHTYGKGSAYVELQDWEAEACSDCGELVDDGDCFCCPRCGSRLCESCTTLCQGCDEYYCYGCIGKCDGCNAAYCPACLETCPACRKRFCGGCREEETRLCHACHKKQQQQKEKQDDPPRNNTDRQPAGRTASRRSRRRAPVPA